MMRAFKVMGRRKLVGNLLYSILCGMILGKGLFTENYLYGERKKRGTRGTGGMGDRVVGR